jgi:hypothetical protein
MARADDLIASNYDFHNLDRVSAMLHVLISDLSADYDKSAEVRAPTISLILACLENLRKVADTQERIKNSSAFGPAERAAFIVALHDFTLKIDAIFPTCETAEDMQTELRKFLEAHPLLNIRPHSRG